MAIVDKSKVQEAIKKIKAENKKRKFTQSIDLIINLKNLDMKKEADKVDEYVRLPNGRGKDAKVCALVGAELKPSADKICDKVVLSDNFSKWTPRDIKKLARDHEYFIGQANIMPDIAKVFGRYFGPLGKMPNPKAGQIVPPKGNLEMVVKKLKATVHLAAKKNPVMSAAVGSESTDDAKIVENVMFVLDHLEHKLPTGKNNIKSVMLKATMGAPVKL